MAAVPPVPPPHYPPGPYASPPHRPIGVAILAILVMLGGILLILVAILVLFLAGASYLGGLAFFGLAGTIVGGVFLIFGLIFLGVGLGLWHLRPWAWWLAVIVMVLSIFGSLSSPITLVLPLLLLVYLVVVRRHFR